MKKRHQPDNDGKTGEVGKMGEDTENNIGKKILQKNGKMEFAKRFF